MAKRSIKDVNPQPERLEVSGRVITIRPPDLNALAEMEEFFGVSFSEIEGLLNPHAPSFFKNIRAVVLALVHIDYPEATEHEVGKAITAENLEVVAEMLSRVFNKGLPLGEATAGEKKET
jgi:hypothetical protein